MSSTAKPTNGCATAFETRDAAVHTSQQDYEALTPVRKDIQERVQDQLDLYKRNLITGMTVDELRKEAARVANDVIESGAVRLPDGIGSQQIIEQVVAESIGLGPIEPLLQDETISEVMGQRAAGRLRRASRPPEAGARTLYRCAFVDERHRAHRYAARPAYRRGRANGRRKARGRFAR